MPPAGVTPGPGPDRAALQRRTVRVLFGAQACGGVGVAVGVGVGTLIARQVTRSPALIGLVPTAGVAGAALTAFPLARLAARTGRRAALVLGYLLGAAGGLLVAVSAAAHSFPLLVIGYAIMGMATAASQQSRYAAADLAVAARRGRHLSVVVWATTIGAVGGANLLDLSSSTARAAGLPALAGPYLAAIAGYAVSATVVWALLRPDPLAVARRRAGPPRRVPVSGVLRTVGSSRAAAGVVAAIAVAHAVMVGVMSFTPLQMRLAGVTYPVIGFVTGLHIFGMYGMSPVVGWLTDRVGRQAVVRGGLLLLVAACAVEGLTPVSAVAWFALGMLMLGLGWSAVLVAGSTLLTDAVPAAARPSAQGVFDMAMNTGGVAGGTLTGIALQGLGFSGTVTLAGGLAAIAALAALPLPRVPIFPGRPAPGRPAPGRPAAVVPVAEGAMEQADEN